MQSVTIGVCAHNEEKNIENSLSAISSQKVKDFKIEEILVVSSGSTDRTDEIVKEYMKKDRRVRLIVQERREGKYSAVNLIIREGRGEIIVLANADNVLAENSLSSLLSPFNDDHVGMTGGHPIPVNSSETITGFAVMMLWDLHHRLSLIVPKTGELIAFRNLGFQLPKGTNTDEDWIRMEIERRGYRVVYVPEAIVYNKGPETIEEFLKQRTRVNIGEMYMKKRFDFTVPTWKPSYLMPALASFCREHRSQIDKIAAAIALEAIARIYATVHVALNRPDKHIWEIAESTKKFSP
ncbi:MAG: glycosyltransferase [Methanomassiliicoccales archaeon]|jgi:cellulose synthase/poly-beta-1,6-N-acetylglucosamine synthase-like glycosyltransferase|nr:glycosyltransferase [Methanomassiliicoccales archaeon]